MRDFSAPGLNPLLQAASPLLILMGRLRTTLIPTDIGTLRRQTLDQIREFEERARAGGVAPETVLAARYALCAAVDEAVLSTPWGSQGEWREQTLLITLHREAWGGEKFFDMLQRISADPARHIDLMELQYVCLALGFAGKFQVAERGHARLAEVQTDLFRRIRTYRGVPPAGFVLALARNAGPAQPRHPLRALVGRGCIYAAGADRNLHLLSSAARCIVRTHRQSSRPYRADAGTTGNASPRRQLPLPRRPACSNCCTTMWPTTCSAWRSATIKLW